jgi:tetratricopeptide (TPR) repeat protein
MAHTRTLVALSVCAVLATGALAQESHVHHEGSEALGTVHFPIACKGDVQSEFTRAVALLHSFGYEEARKAFTVVAEQDSGCGMAWWGIAMSYYHPIWASPTSSELGAGRAAAGRADAAGANTDRERRYIGAINAFYRDSDRIDHHTRALAYETAMQDLAHRFPDDNEASIFYALALLGTASPGDTNFANQREAAAILNGLLVKEPQHPGIPHYLIHAYDYPPLAVLALPAARTYARLAPSSPHALHMPSHIFTRLGLWEESIKSNLASADSARRLVARAHPGAASFDELHALDYLEYAYLQTGDDLKAHRILEGAASAKTFDDPNFAAAYALAAIPARFALERHRWDEAASLEAPDVRLPWDQFPYAVAITYFAQTLGSARAGRAQQARAALARLDAVHAQLVRSPVSGPYDWTGQVKSMRLAAAAWLKYSEEPEQAVDLARAAADLEDRVGKHPVTPGAVLPARELLADMLQELGRPQEALVQYEASLRAAPNRLNGLYGAGRSAEASGDSSKATRYYTQLLDNCRASDRSDVRHARSFLDQHR